MMYHLIRFIRNFAYLVSLCNYSRWDRSHPFVIFTIGHWLPRGFPMPLAWFHTYTYSPALIATLEVYPVQMWQHETFIHFGYITVDIIGCVDGKYEHNSADATCQDFAKIPLLSLLCLSRSIWHSPVSYSFHDHRLVLSLRTSLPLSNIALSDDVISYRVLYISQRISGGRLRFARHSAGEMRFSEDPTTIFSLQIGG